MLAFLRGNPRFFKYWMSTWASELGDWIRNMAITFTILDIAQGSAVAMSFGMFCEFAPLFLFGFLVGVFADRWDRKRTILWAVGVRIAMMLLYVAAVMWQSLALIYVCAFLSALCTLFYRAPAGAFTMQFVPQEDRATAANLRQISGSSMMLIGPALATALYMSIGAAWAMVVTVLLFAVAGVLIAVIRVPALQAAPRDEEQDGVAGVLRDIREGFRYAMHHPIVRPILLTNAFLGFGSGLVNVLEIFVVTEFLHLPKEMFAVLSTVQGAGMLASSFLLAKLKIRTDLMVSVGMIVMGIGLGGMVLYPHLVVTCAGLVLFSLGCIGWNLGTATLMQTRVDFAYQGRTSTTSMTVMHGFLVAALLSAGWLHDLFTVAPVFFAGAMLSVIGGAICWWMFRGAAVSDVENVAQAS